MSVWVTIPSARPVAEVAKWAEAWRERGYKVALWRDQDDLDLLLDLLTQDPTGNTYPGYAVCAWEHAVCALQWSKVYPGYAVAVNRLIADIIERDPDAEWFIAAGDDVFPDPNHTAEEIAEECEDHFRRVGREITNSLSTFGVMQPTGDRWGENPNHARPDMRSAYIDRIAGSAWYGREYCKLVNQGKGPLWPEYQHMFVDEEARAVAVKLGVYWERRDLTQMHMHPGRVKNYTVDMIPEHMKKWASAEHWKEAEAIFFRRRKEGFPGSECL